MSHGDRYSAHLATLDQQLTKALETAGRKGLHVDGVLFHSGRTRYYHRDDHPVSHHTDFHFRRWAPPLTGPEHVVLARPGQRPKVVRVRPRDYWYDTSEPPVSYFEAHTDFTEVASFDQVGAALGELGNVAFVGESKEAAAELGIAEDHVEPEALMAPLDWYRSYKTELEIELTREACQLAATGHAAARDAFLAGASEHQIHTKYLEATGHLENQLPYESIVALDTKAAVLHYQHKRGPEAAPGNVFLLDAGAAVDGYAADLTRTWFVDTVPEPMKALIRGVDAMERDLVAMVTSGRPYLDIHVAAHRGAARILTDLGILETSADEAFDRGLTHPFFPHGVGHPIGLQVHDVAGFQAGPEGGNVPAPDDYPFLRCTRILEPGHLVTIEPGLYFVEMLLEPFRQGPDADAFDWDLVDQLTPYGGCRIEDNVVVTEDGPVDLSRELIGGP